MLIESCVYIRSNWYYKEICFGTLHNWYEFSKLSKVLSNWWEGNQNKNQTYLTWNLYNVTIKIRELILKWAYSQKNECLFLRLRSMGQLLTLVGHERQVLSQKMKKHSPLFSLKKRVPTTRCSIAGIYSDNYFPLMVKSPLSKFL